MSASSQLAELLEHHQRVYPIFRKTGSKVEEAKAFKRARDVEAIMDVMPQIWNVIEAAETDLLRSKRTEYALADLEKALGRTVKP